MRLENLLSKFLYYGTWTASLIITVGLFLILSNITTSTYILNAGIALFILLPIIRVVLMMIVFLQEKDYRFGMITALILVIIFLSFMIGMHSSSLSG